MCTHIHTPYSTQDETSTVQQVQQVEVATIAQEHEKSVVKDSVVAVAVEDSDRMETSTSE